MRKARPSGPRAPRVRRPPTPLNGARLDALALAYVARFATSRAKLARYLDRKLREFGWDDPQPVADRLSEIVARCERLGFVNDGEFARMRAGAMTRRGLGDRRVRAQLAVDGIDACDAAPAIESAVDAALVTAIAFARRRRLGPFGAGLGDDRKSRERQFGAMLRAGHSASLARMILAIEPGDTAALAALDDDVNAG